MKTTLLNAWRWSIRRLPEAMLVLLVLALLPGLVLVVLEVRAVAARFISGPSTLWRATVQDPWPAAGFLVCLVGVGLATFLLWRNWPFVWATGRKLIVEALHRKIVLVLLVFFVVMMLLLPFVLKTEGSQMSRVQLVLLYSLVLAMVLLSLVAIFLSAASICSEIESKQVHITDTKPMRRWQFLLGKWFGTVVLCSSVMFVMTAAVGGVVLYLARPPKVAHLQPREAAAILDNHRRLWEQVLVARREFLPVLPPDLDAKVAREIEEQQETGTWPKEPMMRRRRTRDLRKALIAERWTVPLGRARGWEFRGLRPDQEGNLQVRFKAFSTRPNAALRGRWLVLQRKQVKDEDGKMVSRPVVVHAVLAPPEGWFSQVRRSIDVPGQFVGDDGTLLLSYENLSVIGDAVFDPDNLVEVLQSQGPFLPNYYRALLVLFCYVGLLSALGLMAGSLFSFPVASLTVVFIVIVGLVGPWFVSFLSPNYEVPLPLWRDMLKSAWRAFCHAVLTVMPHFGKYNPLGQLSDGMMVTWRLVLKSGAVMLFVKGGLALLVGAYFYSRRELARVIVR